MMFYRGKRARKRTLARPVLLALSLILVLGLSVGGTLAFLIADTDPVINTFTPGEVTTEIDEDFENKLVKENVCIKNTGDVDVYIRATIVANWVDKNGNIIAPAEENEDYTPFKSEAGWVKHSDGYHYWTEPVAPGTSTGELIDSCQPYVDAKPVGADHLQMTILSQAIQAEPEQAIKEAWGVTISGGAVTPVSGT